MNFFHQTTNNHLLKGTVLSVVVVFGVSLVVAIPFAHAQSGGYPGPSAIPDAEIGVYGLGSSVLPDLTILAAPTASAPLVVGTPVTLTASVRNAGGNIAACTVP